MHSSSYLLALCAMFTAIAAVPMKRELVVNTVTEIDIVTDVVTATVWVDAPTEPTQHAGVYGYEGPESKPWTQPAAPSTTSSVYIAPLPTSTSSSTTLSSTSQVVIPAAYTPPPPPPVVSTPSPSSSSVYVAPSPPTTTSTSEYVAPSPTSQYVAPAPTTTSTSEYVAPTPAYTPPAYTPPTAPTTTTPAPAAVSITSSSSSGSKTYTGDITFYDVGLGSCGYTNTDSEDVVAMAVGLMDKATMCGKMVTISMGGVTKTAKVVDTCMGCADGNLDMSPTLFEAFAPMASGRVAGAKWWFNN